jgi:hypothetical protein
MRFQEFPKVRSIRICFWIWYISALANSCSGSEESLCNRCRIVCASSSRSFITSQRGLSGIQYSAISPSKLQKACIARGGRHASPDVVQNEKPKPIQEATAKPRMKNTACSSTRPPPARDVFCQLKSPDVIVLQTYACTMINSVGFAYSFCLVQPHS